MKARLFTVYWSSWRSLLSLYAKMMTLLFALYCVVSGQTIKTASALIPGDNLRTIKGRVLFSSDSSVVKNVRLYLCHPICPVYGIGTPCYPARFDSTRSNAEGYFTITAPAYHLSGFTLMTDTVSQGKDRVVFSSPSVSFPNGNSGTETFYLHLYEQPNTSALPASESKRIEQLHVNHGSNLTIKIPNLDAGKTKVSVVAINGKKVARIDPMADGTIHWNSAAAAKGVYFLAISTGGRSISVKIIVQ